MMWPVSQYWPVKLVLAIHGNIGQLRHYWPVRTEMASLQNICQSSQYWPVMKLLASQVSQTSIGQSEQYWPVMSGNSVWPVKPVGTVLASLASQASWDSIGQSSQYQPVKPQLASVRTVTASLGQSAQIWPIRPIKPVMASQVSHGQSQIVMASQDTKFHIPQAFSNFFD